MKNSTKGNTSSIDTDFIGISNIEKALRGTFISNTMKAAIKLDLFSLLEKKNLTECEIKLALNLNGRGLSDFLDALVCMGLLFRQGYGEHALYGNTKESSVFLVKNSPNDLSWWFPQKMEQMEEYWGKLTEALKTGKPQRSDLKDKQLFESNYSSEEKSRIFIGGMNLGQLGSFNDFACKFDFSRYSTFCDVGGSNGFLSILVAKQNPDLKLKTFDLPALEKIAKEKIAEEGLTDRITVVNGDFFKDDLPHADVITMGMILHDWSIEEKKQLIAKAYAALPEGGAFVAIESFIDNERKQNMIGLMMSLHMLLVTEKGFDYTPAEFCLWARDAGFKRTEVLLLDGESDAVIAFK